MKMLHKLTLLTLALSVPAAPALAIPDAGSDYILSGTRTVREWVPAPVGPGGAGAWKLIDLRDRTYFLGASDYRRVLDTRTPQKGEDVLVGVSSEIKGTESVIASTQSEAFAQDIKNPYQRLIRDGFLNITKLSLYERWEDKVHQWPWTRYDQYRPTTRDILTYRFEWTDPITHEALQELDLNLEYGSWQQGALFNKNVHDTGIATESRRVTLPSVERELVIFKAALSNGEAVSPLEASRGSKQSSYTSDATSTGKQVALQGGKVRAAMRASEAIASSADTKPVTGGGNPNDPPPATRTVVLTSYQRLGLNSLISTLTKVEPKIGSNRIRFEQDHDNRIVLYRTGDKAGQVKVKGFGYAQETYLPFTFERQDNLVKIHFVANGKDMDFTLDLDKGEVTDPPED